MRSPGFDGMLIAGTSGLALLSGAVVVYEPSLFVPILLTDLWLLGYHHVISTFTRLCFDAASARQHRFLLFYLPPLLFIATLGVMLTLGFAALVSIYLYWQWFHYTRQSWGLAQAYRRKSPSPAPEPAWLTACAFYSLPVWGILHRSAQSPETFIGLELWVLPIPQMVAQAAAAASLVSIAAWGGLRVLALLRGRAPRAQSVYLLTHFIIFYVGYIAIDDITPGWLVVNIWHNSQYILFVWLYNTKRFSAGPDPAARFISWLSQPHRWWIYMLACLAITTLLYRGIASGIERFAPDLALAATIVVYQTINFHHYIVDALIWRLRQAPVSRVLGLTAAS